MKSLLQDVRYGLRVLRKSPGFTAVAVITLALGIGANTAIFSVVDAIWLRPLPIQDPGGLIRIADQKPDDSEDASVSYPAYLDYRAQSTAFSGIAAVSLRAAIFKTNGESKLLMVGEVSPNYLSLLGVGTALGRIFTEPELAAPNPPLVVMLDFSAWHRYFGGDPHIIGKTIVLNDRDCVVAGVLPRGFRGTEAFVAPQLWMPISTWARISGDGYPTDRRYRQFDLFARLAPEHSLQQARPETSLIANRLAQTYPKTDVGRKINVAYARDLRNPLLRLLGALLLAVAALVLLIACANVSNLFLARGEARRKELATRIALGGTRARLTWQLAIEGLPLSLLGTAFAVLLARSVIQLLPSLLPATEFPIGFDFRLDTRVLLFAAALCIFAVALFAVIPALRLSRIPPASVMKESSGASRRQPRWSLPNLIVVGQMAASMVLLTGAGLLVKTLVLAETRDVGFARHQQMVLMDPEVGVLHPGQLQPYLDSLISRVEQFPALSTLPLPASSLLVAVEAALRRLFRFPGRRFPLTTKARKSAIAM